MSVKIPQLRRVPAVIKADLSKESLEAAAILFISEKIDGKLPPTPDRFQLFVHQYAMPQARMLVQELVNPYPVFDVLPSPNLTLEEHEWYLGAEGYPFVVDGNRE